MIAHVFVDAENISPAVTFKVVEHFGKEHTITKVDIIAKEDTLPYRYRALDKKLYRVQNCFYGKNSADTWLCIEIVRAIIDEPELELIIIVSSDKDFLPVIKFSVDFEKKVFVVSSGFSHKSLAEQLRLLRVPPEAVELKDFRLKFDVPFKLEKFLPMMSFDTKKFFFDRENQIKFILVKHDAQLFEVPFVAGMNSYVFGRVLRELNILGKRDSVREFVAQNFLKLTRNKIYFRTEAEISIPTPAEQIEKFFIEHAAQIRKIFVKHNEKLYEVPFVDGMPLGIFGQMLREKKIIGKNTSTSAVAVNSLLAVRDEKVFLNAEENLDAAYDLTIKDTGEYFSRHAEQIGKIFVKHAQKFYDLPFVDGMPLSLFEKHLREQNIIGKSVSAASVAQKSLLDVRDGRVWLIDERELEAAQDDLENNVDNYLNANALDIRTAVISHGGENFSIPFVDGMPAKIFGKLLRERKIIDRKTLPEEIAADNGFAIRDGKIFRH